jgi:class 3 adenylate cyclase/tetratricopeptide (TPR) repeat protein
VCGQVNPEIARFCVACGAPVERQRGVLAEERKTVTVLFCDLVGVTAASDDADPEDVRARIRPYHARLRREVEGFGGTVEKFIGDAVMAVFGAPSAHEDDPERAVRAGLRIVEAVADLNETGEGLGLAVRVGVETGEAVVVLGARPELGEGLVTGDVVNTASRLQGVAPTGGVLAGPGTYAATRDVFGYQPLDPVVLKGKAEPVPVFRAVAPRARQGIEVTRSLGTPLVGRQIDLGIVTGAFHKAVQESAVQLVVVAGEPGVGKSRLVAELLSFVDAWPGLVRWRQGRCLPYGEGITFWALGEIVKAGAGILETDPPEAAAAKIDAIIPDDAPDAPWLRARLRPLAGLAAPQAGREENFAAWQAFIELLAEDNPTVLVFEDLHWADPAMLDFLEHLADHAEGVPLLLVCTARPELFEKAPTWAASARDLARVNLRPLGPAETSRLISQLLGAVVLPAEVQEAILDRAGGNPLYVEQFVRLLQDQQLLIRAGATWRLEPDAEIPLPPGVHGLIAARLDTLTAERKRLLQDAAVVGKVFWSGAIAAMGGQDEAEVRAALHELARMELLRPARHSSMAGQAEYSFGHALIREVCYGQIPRADRAQRHQRAAAWIEAIAGQRADDQAEILAAHYTTALGLAQAAHDPGAGELADRAARYLMLAGDRAMGIDVAAAERHYARALELTSGNHPQRAELLARHAEALQQRGRLPEAARAYEQVIELFRARGQIPSLAAAMGAYEIILERLGDPRHWTLSAEALALVEPLGPSPTLVHALAKKARTSMVWGDNRDAIEHADRALTLAARLGLPEPARALGIRGHARTLLGDPAGLEDQRRALNIANDLGMGREVAILYNNLAESSWLVQGPRQRLELARAGSAFAKRRGIEEVTHGLNAIVVRALVDLGSLAEAISLAGELTPRFEEAEDVLALVEVRSALLLALNVRGEYAAAAALGHWIAERAHELANPADLADAYPLAATLRVAQGDVSGAITLLTELSQAYQAREYAPYAANLGEAVRAALAAGAPELAAGLAEGVQTTVPLGQNAMVTARAVLAEHHGEHAEAAVLFADAANRWELFGVPWERAQALLGQGRCLLALGRPAEAQAPLQTAREIFASLGANPSSAETGRYLERANALTALQVLLSSGQRRRITAITRSPQHDTYLACLQPPSAGQVTADDRSPGHDGSAACAGQPTDERVRTAVGYHAPSHPPV